MGSQATQAALPPRRLGGPAAAPDAAQRLLLPRGTHTRTSHHHRHTRRRTRRRRRLTHVLPRGCVCVCAGEQTLFIVYELLRDNLYHIYKYIEECNLPKYFTTDRLREVARQCLQTCAAPPPAPPPAPPSAPSRAPPHSNVTFTRTHTHAPSRPPAPAPRPHPHPDTHTRAPTAQCMHACTCMCMPPRLCMIAVHPHLAPLLAARMAMLHQMELFILTAHSSPSPLTCPSLVQDGDAA
jgi:hypothetical protein